MAEEGGLPDDAIVVRGGRVPFEMPLGEDCVVHPKVGCFGFSVQSAAGRPMHELAGELPNRSVGVTTIGAIRGLGYDVISTPGRGSHATVVVPVDWTDEAADELAQLFKGARNPNPRRPR